MDLRFQLNKYMNSKFGLILFLFLEIFFCGILFLIFTHYSLIWILYISTIISLGYILFIDIWRKIKH